MQCQCGGVLKERQQNNKPYHLCSQCTRVFAPTHRETDRTNKPKQGILL